MNVETSTPTLQGLRILARIIAREEIKRQLSEGEWSHRSHDSPRPAATHTEVAAAMQAKNNAVVLTGGEQMQGDNPTRTGETTFLRRHERSDVLQEGR